MVRTKKAVSKSSKEPSHKERVQMVSKRQINEGRPVNTAHLDTFNTLATFTTLQWLSFVHLPSTIYPKRIREFYASFAYEEGDEIVTFTIGPNDYTFPLNQFGTFLNIPSDGMKFYEDSHNLTQLPYAFTMTEIIDSICKPNVPHTKVHLLGKDLKDDCAVWNKIVGSNIFPKSGHHSEISVSQAVFLHALRTNTKINMTHFIAKRMCGLPSGRRDLPYGRLLTRLFQNLPNLPSAPATPATSVPIDLTTLRKMSSHAGTKRAHSSSTDTEEAIDRFTFATQGDEAESSIPPTYEDVEGTMDERITTLNRNLNELRREHRKLRKDVKGVKGMLRVIMKALKCEHGGDGDADGDGGDGAGTSHS